jgi:hypothetical protein
LPAWKLPSLPKLEFPKVDFSAVSKALLEALPKPKPGRAATNTTPATEAPTLEPPRTSPEPAAQRTAPVDSKLITPAPPRPTSPYVRPTTPAPPRPTSPYVRPTGASKPSASPSTSSPSSGPKPSKRFKLSHTLPVLFFKHVFKLVKKRFFKI